MSQSDAKKFVKDVFKLIGVAFVSGVVGTGVTHVYTWLVPEVSMDEDLAQQSRMVFLLEEISEKLNSVPYEFKAQEGLPKSVGDPIMPSSIPRDLGLNSGDVDLSKLSISFDKPQYHARAFGFGRKFYKTALYLEGLEAANISASGVKELEWDFVTGQAVTKGIQPLYLQKLGADLVVQVKVHLNEKLNRERGSNKPIELSVKITL